MHPDAHPDGEPRPDLIPLQVPVPPGLAHAFGYRGNARFVGFHWEPSGDEVIFDDGRFFGTGEGWSFLAYLRHRVVAPHLQPYNVGFSDMDAMHALVIDRAHDLAGVIPISDVRSFLKRQHPPPPQLTPDQLDAARRAIEATLVRGWREQQIDPKVVLRAMQEHRQAMADMLSYLDRWPHV